MKIIYPLFVFAFLFSGCVNERGISGRYYNDCREYYDAQGYYHKKCDENIIEFQDVKNTFKEKKEPPKSNVW